MLTIYDLKPLFQSLLRPLVRRLFLAKVTANQITLTAVIGSLLVALIMILSLPNTTVLWMMPVWMFIRMALNAMDGMLAKEFNQQTKLGAYLNELGDVISDSALFLVFIYVVGVNIYAIALILFLSILSEYAGVMAPLIGENRRYDGPMGKSDRAFVFSLLSIIIALNLLPFVWINGILYCVSVSLVYTIFNRIRFAVATKH